MSMLRAEEDSDRQRAEIRNAAIAGSIAQSDKKGWAKAMEALKSAEED